MTAGPGLRDVALRALLVSALVVPLVAAMPASAVAEPGTSCAERFPEVVWVEVLDGPVTVEATSWTALKWLYR